VLRRRQVVIGREPFCDCRPRPQLRWRADLLQSRRRASSKQGSGGNDVGRGEVVLVALGGRHVVLVRLKALRTDRAPPGRGTFVGLLRERRRRHWRTGCRRDWGSRADHGSIVVVYLGRRQAVTIGFKTDVVGVPVAFGRPRRSTGRSLRRHRIQCRRRRPQQLGCGQRRPTRNLEGARRKARRGIAQRIGAACEPGPTISIGTAERRAGTRLGAPVMVRQLRAVHLRRGEFLAEPCLHRAADIALASPALRLRRRRNGEGLRWRDVLFAPSDP